jgi:hypothetical protein
MGLVGALHSLRSFRRRLPWALAVAMKPYLHILLKTVLSTLAGLIAGCLLVSTLITIFTERSITLETIQNIVASSAIVFIFAFVPSLVWGASLYALAWSKGKASYFTATLIGAAPGLLLLLPKRSGLAELILYFGIGIAVCTHYFAKSAFIANLSFKPT